MKTLEYELLISHVGTLNMRKIFLLLWLGLAIANLGTGCRQEEPLPPAPEKLPLEEKKVRKEARDLGSRLYSMVKDKPEPKSVVEEEKQQQTLAPVYDDIEKFIFRQLQPYKERIASITVVYKNSGILCIVYVKAGADDDELAKLKRATDSCVGKIIDNLPLVRYLIVRNQSE
jgi:hypothetical protein